MINHFYEKIDGWFDFQSIYKKMVDDAKDGFHFVEVGAWKGKSTSFMAVEIINSEKNIKFDVVDHWEAWNNINSPLLEEFLNNIEPVKNHIKYIIGDSVQSATLYEDNSLDFVFLDAGHFYDQVKSDIEAWLPKVKHGGWIGGHDYTKEFPGLCDAVNEKFKNREIILNSWLVKKSSSEVFVSYCDKGFLPYAEYLVKSLQEFSSRKIILYGLNCDIPYSYPNLIKQRVDLDLNIDSLTRYKPGILSKVIDLGFDNFIFLDADVIVKSNIDKIWDMFEDIKELPAPISGPWYHSLVNNRDNPPKEFLEKYNVDYVFHYVQSNMILFNNLHKQFMEEWSELCLNKDNIEFHKNYYYLYDETMLNILLRKYKFNKIIPLIMPNSYTLCDAKFILEKYKADGQLDGYRPTKNDMSEIYTKLPSDKNNIVAFHGGQDVLELEKIFNYLKGLKMKTGFIITAYCNTPEKNESLFKLVIKIRQMPNIFLIVSAHTPIELRTQNLCDFVIYDKDNPVDERKYSHGAAESTLIYQALEILNLHKIEKTFKLTYDCEIQDLNIFESWKKPGYEMVTSKWGDINMSTFAWYGNVDFMMNTFSYFFTVDEMFKRGNILEKIWEEDVINQKLENRIFLFNDFRTDMFPGNKVDLFWKDYDKKKLSRAFVTYFDAGFLEVGKGLIQSLGLFSKEKIIAYTINFDMVEDYPNLIKKRLDVDLNENLIYEKPGVLLESLKDIDNGIFLDADTMVNHNIDDLWDALYKIKNLDGNRAQWEYCFFNGVQNPSPELLELVGSPSGIKSHYRQTNLIFYKNTSVAKDFLNEWKHYCKGNDDKSLEIRENSYIVDESIFNALLNKNWDQRKNTKPYSCNAASLKDVLYIESHSKTNEDLYDDYDLAYFPERGKVDAYSMRIPEDKNEIKMFHGVKEKDEIAKVLNYLENKYVKLPTEIPFKTTLINLYSEIKKNTVTNIPIQKDAVRINLYNNDDYKVSFHDGASVDILNPGKDYEIEFWDIDKNSLVYKIKITEGWSRPSPKYLVNWKVIVNGKEHIFNLEGKDVFIKFDSKALGDNIAWISSAQKFKEKYNCNVFVATFWNDLFTKSYSQLTFVDLNYTSPSLYATYLIGCKDNDYNYNKRNWRVIPLHTIADDILNVDDTLITPTLDFVPGNRPIENKYVAINTESTMQAKFWNYEHGWQTLVDYIKSLGYDVIVTQKNKTDLNGVYDKSNGTIQDAINIIHHSEAFIGLGSGLSWASWAIGKEPIIIHGFENNWYLPSNFQVMNPKVCNGCYHDISEDFGRNWNWCPRNKKFECTSTIKPKQVIETLKEYLKISKK